MELESRGSLTSLSPAAAELKALIVETGVELLDDAGLHFDFETVSYANVFRELKEMHGVTVTGSSVHGRIWPSQEHFQLDVVAELYRQDPTHSRESLEGLLSIFDDVSEGLEPEERTREVLRRLGMHFASRAGLWRWVQMILMYAAASHSLDPEIAGKFQELNHQHVVMERVMWSARFQQLFHRLGLAPKENIDESLPEMLHKFVLISARLMSGFVLDCQRSDPSPGEEIVLESPLSDNGLPWSLLSLSFYSNTMALFEQARPDGRSLVPPANKDDLVIPTPGPRIASVQPQASQRRSRDELRALLIQVGIDRIQRQGVELKPASLSYRTVFERIRRDRGFTVNRSSVHKRFWESHDAFRLEVLGAAADQLRFVTEDEDLRPTLPVGYTSEGVLDVKATIKLRGEAAKQYRAAFENDHGAYHRSLILKCALLGVPEAVDDAKDALSYRLDAARLRHVHTMQQLILGEIEVYQVGPVPELGIDLDTAARSIASVALTISCGYTLHRNWGGDNPDAFVVNCLDRLGVSESWDLDVFAMYAVMDHLLQLPD